MNERNNYLHESRIDNACVECTPSTARYLTEILVPIASSTTLSSCAPRACMIIAYEYKWHTFSCGTLVKLRFPTAGGVACMRVLCILTGLLVYYLGYVQPSCLCLRMFKISVVECHIVPSLQHCHKPSRLRDCWQSYRLCP